MSTDPTVQRLVATMRDRQVELAGRRFRVDKDKVVAGMIEASQTLAPQRIVAWRARTLGALALAAGFALLVWGGAQMMGGRGSTFDAFEVVALKGDVVRVLGGARNGLAPGQPLSVGADGSIETSAGAEARIKTPDGFEIQLLENTRVFLSELRTGSSASALRLDSGGVRCVIPHLPDGHSFAVITPDARVVDRGTVFSVSVESSASGARTSVRVEEGVVDVLHRTGGVRLGATESWTSGTPSAEPVRLAVPEPLTLDEAAPIAEENPRSRAGAGPAKRDSGATKRRAETLGEETRLLRSGLASERKADLQGAAASFELLLSRYPDSPLAPDARAALLRVKSSLGNSR